MAIVSAPEVVDPRLVAAVKLLERTGAREFQIRYSDDQPPTVWIALARWHIGDDGRPRKSGGRVAWKAGAALDPVAAVLRLADDAIDGGTCTHCGRPSGVSTDIDSMPLEDLVCWYQYDPELATFRRGCE